jgi:hypothetical protein
MQTKALGRWAALVPLLVVAIHSTPAVAQDVRALTKAYNASGQALFQELARTPGNLVVSPYAIGTAMAMARASCDLRRLRQGLQARLLPAGRALDRGAMRSRAVGRSPLPAPDVP